MKNIGDIEEMRFSETKISIFETLEEKIKAHSMGMFLGEWSEGGEKWYWSWGWEIEVIVLEKHYYIDYIIQEQSFHKCQRQEPDWKWLGWFMMIAGMIYKFHELDVKELWLNCSCWKGI